MELGGHEVLESRVQDGQELTFPEKPAQHEVRGHCQHHREFMGQPGEAQQCARTW